MTHTALVAQGSLLALALATAAAAGETSLSGSVTAELRTFTESPAYEGQLAGEEASVVVEPTLDWASEDGRDQIRILGYWRHDGEDHDRSHFDLREAYWRRAFESWELLVGANRIFWGVTESRHLVDVVNQSDTLEAIDDDAKLGQPMIELSTQRSWGRLSGFVLLGFRERELPGRAGRLRPPLPVARSVYESGAGDHRIDLALRWSHSFGIWDLGAHAFHGTSREPRYLPTADGQELIAAYDVVTQAGLDAQLTRGAWLGKLELLVRSGQGADFGAAVVGFERTLYQVFGSPADVGLLVEALWDGRDASAPPTPFDDDLFFGARLAFNDVQDTQVVAGLVVDRNDGSQIVKMEVERRLGSDYSLELESHWFVDTERSPALAAVGRDDVLTLSVTRHF